MTKKSSGLLKSLSFFLDKFRGRKELQESVVETSHALKAIFAEIHIPCRSDLQGDKIERLNTLKSQFSLTFDNSQLASMDYGVDYLCEDMSMYAQLCLQNIFKLDDIGYTSEVEKHLDIVLDILRLQKYAERIQTIIDELELCIIAFSELCTEKSREIDRFPKGLLRDFLYRERYDTLTRKLRRMYETVDCLKTSLIIGHSQLKTVSDVITTYRTSCSNLFADFPNGNMANLLQNRHTLVSGLADLIIDKATIRENDEKDLTTLEVFLEEYIYSHKEEFPKVREQLKSLLPCRDKQKTVATFWMLEAKYLVYYIYGRGIVSDKDLSELYEIGFELLTQDECMRVHNPFKEIKGRFKLEQFGHVAERRLNKILSDDNSSLIMELFGDITNYNETCKYIRNAFRTSDGDFDFAQILLYDRTMDFLLAFDRTNGMAEFFDNPVEKRLYDEVYFGMKFNFKIPLSTVYQLSYFIQGTIIMPSYSASLDCYSSYTTISLEHLYRMYARKQLQVGKLIPILEGAFSIGDLELFIINRETILKSFGVPISSKTGFANKKNSFTNVVLPSTITKITFFTDHISPNDSYLGQIRNIGFYNVAAMSDKFDLKAFLLFVYYLHLPNLNINFYDENGKIFTMQISKLIPHGYYTTDDNIFESFSKSVQNIEILEKLASMLGVQCTIPYKKVIRKINGTEHLQISIN